MMSGQQLDVSVQSLALQTLECDLCNEDYGEDFNHVPRILSCGHTYCTLCLERMLKAKGVQCPVCGALSPLSKPDITQLSPNITVLEILKSKARREGQTTFSQPLCEVCNTNPVAVACIDCQPGSALKFCEVCDRKEHDRDFAPVRRHRRYLPDRVPVETSFIPCNRHMDKKADYYSERLNEFACGVCELASDWPTRAKHFETITKVSVRLRSYLQKLNVSSVNIMGNLADSRIQIENILLNIEPSAMTAKTKIAEDFAKIIDQLQARQQKLLKHVDEELTERRRCLEQQLQQIQSKSEIFKFSHKEVNDLIPKEDFEFLVSYRNVVEKLEQLLSSEDRSLLKPVTTHDIPFHLPKDVSQKLSSLGAVCGGHTPTELTTEPSGRTDLMCLTWLYSEDVSEAKGFEVQFEQVQKELSEILNIPGDCQKFSQREPQYQQVAGSEPRAYIDFLCPGYTYKFRVRSQNAAGWGMWSESVTETCVNFPLKIGYTKRIHRICIPHSGHYRITAQGAKATDGLKCTGGKGAIISATFSFKQGDILILLCGGMSQRIEYSSGGGGGTFVAHTDITHDNLLIVAGGGGGTRGRDRDDFNGDDASLEPNGTDGQGAEHGNGGVNGDAGEDADKPEFPGPCWGYGGAGALIDASSSSSACSFLSGGKGGRNGGFGGGGGAGSWGGGGGGGYSGGGGGRGGGGGGSFVRNDATNISKKVGNEGEGCVLIERADLPYPLEPSESQNEIEGACYDLARMSSQSSSNGSRWTTHTQSSRESIGVISDFINAVDIPLDKPTEPLAPVQEYHTMIEETMYETPAPNTYMQYTPQSSNQSSVHTSTGDHSSPTATTTLIDGPLQQQEVAAVTALTNDHPSVTNMASSVSNMASQGVSVYHHQQPGIHGVSSDPALSTAQPYPPASVIFNQDSVGQTDNSNFPTQDRRQS